MNLQEIIGKSLHTRRFLEEFSFDRTQFTPPASSEVELADAVVMLGEVLFIFQMKERQASASHTEESERRWLQTKVLKKAVSQVKDTLAHLSSGSDILVPNIHGAQRLRQAGALLGGPRGRRVARTAMLRWGGRPAARGYRPGHRPGTDQSPAEPLDK